MDSWAAQKKEVCFFARGRWMDGFWPRAKKKVCHPHLVSCIISLTQLPPPPPGGAAAATAAAGAAASAAAGAAAAGRKQKATPAKGAGGGGSGPRHASRGKR